MRKKLELKGKRFGKLVVTEEIDRGNPTSEWLCDCDCGTKDYVAIGTKLNRGITVSCGCIGRKKVAKEKTTHGMRNTKIYTVWTSMKQRCNNPNSNGYKYYGKRGIKVCEKWDKFEGFYEDMGSTYEEGLYIDRIDNDKDYCKDNCRWMTVEESNRNKRSTLTEKQVREIRKSNKTRTELAEKYEVHYMTIVKVLKRITWKNV